jgi:hypothetical protein
MMILNLILMADEHEGEGEDSEVDVNVDLINSKNESRASMTLNVRGSNVEAHLLQVQLRVYR